MSNSLVTNRSEAAPAPKAPRAVANGPTCGYRDAKGGGLERNIFEDGVLPRGWHDSPDKCKNEWDQEPIPLI